MQQQPPTPDIRWFIAVLLVVLAFLAVIWFGSERTGGKSAALPPAAVMLSVQSGQQSPAGSAVVIVSIQGNTFGGAVMFEASAQKLAV
ncbi:hypothetical protein SAMN05216217_11641 [Halopseudomonas yangmingensis]|uniref:Uncharacterized protein n=1 Tax=Halopseudomonas yangmingensis TaxID=1720063 RepID=A0A1I4TVM8_9GAMM|nr:hypothetical protein SAMN05216217_11641 [Halopseudomonas yangmingensis]